MQFDHPNAKGVLMPGQDKFHKGKLVPRGGGDAEETPVCAVLCSPVGQFPPPVNKKGTVHKRGEGAGAAAGGGKPGAGAAKKGGSGNKKENVSANLPMEASLDKLM